MHTDIKNILIDANDIVMIKPVTKGGESLCRVVTKRLSNLGKDDIVDSEMELVQNPPGLAMYVPRSWLADKIKFDNDGNKLPEKTLQRIKEALEASKDEYYKSQDKLYVKALFLESTLEADELGICRIKEASFRNSCIITERNNVILCDRLICSKLAIRAKDIVLRPFTIYSNIHYVMDEIYFDYYSAFVDWCRYTGYQVFNVKKIVIKQEIKKDDTELMVRTLFNLMWQGILSFCRCNKYISSHNSLDRLDKVEVHISNDSDSLDTLYYEVNEMMGNILYHWKEHDEVYWNNFSNHYPIMNQSVTDKYNAWLVHQAQAKFMMFICDSTGWSDKRYNKLLADIFRSLGFKGESLSEVADYISDGSIYNNELKDRMIKLFGNSDKHLPDLWDRTVEYLKQYSDKLKKL